MHTPRLLLKPVPRCADISFWRNKKNMEGMSVRSLFMGLFFQVGRAPRPRVHRLLHSSPAAAPLAGWAQLVITLYLFDNDTSWMILVSSALETVMGVWKLSKALKLKVRARPPQGAQPASTH